MCEDLMDDMERDAPAKPATVQVEIVPPHIDGRFAYYGGCSRRGIALPRGYGPPSGHVFIYREIGTRCAKVQPSLADCASLTLTATVPELRAIATALLSAAADIEGES